MARTETERLQKILQGAFEGPTPLKDIPTRWGKQRAERAKDNNVRVGAAAYVRRPPLNRGIR